MGIVDKIRSITNKISSQEEEKELVDVSKESLEEKETREFEEKCRAIGERLGFWKDISCGSRVEKKRKFPTTSTINSFRSLHDY